MGKHAEIETEFGTKLREIAAQRGYESRCTTIGQLSLPPPPPPELPPLLSFYCYYYYYCFDVCCGRTHTHTTSSSYIHTSHPHTFKQQIISDPSSKSQKYHPILLNVHERFVLALCFATTAANLFSSLA